MTNDEATKLLTLMRGMWPAMYLREEGEIAWRFFFEDKPVDDALSALRLLADRHPEPIAMATFVSAVKEVKARKFTCPRCGHGMSSAEAVADHLANVHGEWPA